MLSIHLDSQEKIGEEPLLAVGESARVRELIANGADVETRNPQVGFDACSKHCCGLLYALNVVLCLLSRDALHCRWQ